MSAPTLLQSVPTLAGGGVARATLEAAQAVIDKEEAKAKALNERYAVLEAALKKL